MITAAANLGGLSVGTSLCLPTLLQQKHRDVCEVYAEHESGRERLLR